MISSSGRLAASFTMPSVFSLPVMPRRETNSGDSYVFVIISGFRISFLYIFYDSAPACSIKVTRTTDHAHGVRVQIVCVDLSGFV